MNLFQAHNEIIIMNNKYSKFYLSLKIYGLLYNKMVCHLLIFVCISFITFIIPEKLLIVVTQ